jgi:acyl-CoA synthetase (AMP-forming)/AMP-acid ligase II
MNTADFLTIATAICPDRDAITFEGSRWTYAQFNDRVNRLAHALTTAGVRRGDRIGMLSVNCNQYMEAYFAAVKTGAIFVPLNYRAKADELKYMTLNAEAKILLVGDKYLAMTETLCVQVPSVKEVIAIEGEHHGIQSYEKLLASEPPDEQSIEIEDEEVTILMYTAGTTGRPKGVPLTHNGFVAYVLDNVEPANPEIEERNLLTVPLYHVAGIQAMLAAVYGGRTLVMMRQFEVKEWMETVMREKATRAMLVPTMLKRIIDDPDFARHDLTSLQVITYGAAPMPGTVIQKAIKAMPWVRFINAFGQTETASTIAALGPEDHLIEGTEEEREKKFKRLTSSIGRPLSDVEVKIADRNGNPLPPGSTGELLVRGPRVMTGYWGDQEKSSQVLTPDGWLKTGDMAWMDEEGYLYLSGRGDDMIIRGGENISPEEVEDVLQSHPKVEEAAVIGVPDPEWGQQPRAIVVLKRDTHATPEEIIEFCRARLAGFKRPRSVVFVDALPYNQMGKVVKKELREMYGR